MCLSQQRHYQLSMVCIKMYYNYVIYCMASFMGSQQHGQQSLDRHLKIVPVQIVGMHVCVCVCVCVSTPEAINNQWDDIDLVRLVKQILQLLYGNCRHYC